LSYQANQVVSTFWLLWKATWEKINAIYILIPSLFPEDYSSVVSGRVQLVNLSPLCSFAY
jgi:hypothetical protein